ncbi:putative small secreted protein [Clostridiales Family XIII bacterium PM5-7]
MVKKKLLLKSFSQLRKESVIFADRNKCNMKKIITLILSLVLVLSFTTMACFANTTTDVCIEELPDGSYYEIVITEFENPLSFFATSQTKSGVKTVKYNTPGGTALWSVKVTGRFTYTGTSSKCTSSEVSATSYNANWKISNKSASKSGNTASATATAKQYQGSSAINTITRTVTLTCSAKGALS